MLSVGPGKGRWTHDIDAAIVLCRLHNAAKVRRADTLRPCVKLYAGVPIERLSDPRSMQAQHPGDILRHLNAWAIPRGAITIPPAPIRDSYPSRCITISPLRTIMVSSDAGCVYKGVS